VTSTWPSRLNRWEAEIVRPWVVREPSIRRRVALTVNWLTNGWLFAAVAVVMPVVAGTRGWLFVRVTAVALVAAFLTYIVLKQTLRRVRPCHVSEALSGHVAPLD